MARTTRPKQAIKVTSISKSFGKKLALSDVSFNVPAGSIFGFLGPNGAGKTTTIRCLMDFIRPDNGAIKILGLDARNNSTSLKRSIGYLSSDSQLNLNWTGEEHIKFFENIKGVSKNTGKLIERLGLDTKTKVKALSSGNKQKLAIVLCFAGDPKLLIMDEPTRGLDPLLQNELYAILTDFVDETKTVFLSSHNLGEVERLCDAVMLIRNGKIVEEKSMQDIRDMKIHVISATIKQKFDMERLNKMPNVEVVSKNDNTVFLKVRGDLNELLSFLVSCQLTDITIDHASLEDIFLEQYRG